MSIPERWKGFQELPANIKQALNRLVPLFRREDVLLAYLFGSLSRGRTGGDVDLALLAREKPVFRLRGMITDCLGSERVDLVDLRLASIVLRFEVVRTGRPVYVADQDAQESFELATLRLYQDTQPLRRQQREYLKRRMAQWS